MTAGRWSPRSLARSIPWLQAAYLASYLATAPALFAVTMVVTAICLALNLTAIGIPTAVAAAIVIRGCATAERKRLALFGAAPDDPAYTVPERPGIIAQLKARAGDPATYRELTYLTLAFPPLVLLSGLTLALWSVLATGVTVPLWFSFIDQQFHNGEQAAGLLIGYLPNGPSGPGGFGLFVDNVFSALLVSVVSLIAFRLFGDVLRLVVRLHTHVPQSLLGPPADPLAEAKAILAGPGRFG